MPWNTLATAIINLITTLIPRIWKTADEKIKNAAISLRLKKADFAKKAIRDSIKRERDLNNGT